MTLDKKAILAGAKLKTKTVTIPSGDVLITELSGLEYLEAYKSELNLDAEGNFSGAKFAALLTVRCIIDKKGNRLFEDADAAVLSGGSSTTYFPLVAAVKELNGLAGTEGKN